MLAQPVELPPQLREHGAKYFALPASSRCEALGVAALQPSAPAVLFCTHPALKDNDRVALAAIIGGTALERERVREQFMLHVRRTGISFPDSRITIHKELILLYVPWSYRGEFRTVLAGCVTNVDLSPLPQDRPGRLMLLEHEEGEVKLLDHERFSHQLMQFGMAFDGPLQALRRWVGSKDSHRVWHFPLDCTVEEVGREGDLVWTIEFNELELLERAHALIGPLLSDMQRLGSKLRPENASDVLGDDVQTLVPKMAVRSPGNSRQARVEMVRLLKNLILSLERLTAACDVLEDAVN